jgi:hypothetical protein
VGVHVTGAGPQPGLSNELLVRPPPPDVVLPAKPDATLAASHERRFGRANAALSDSKDRRAALRWKEASESNDLRLGVRDPDMPIWHRYLPHVQRCQACNHW